MKWISLDAGQILEHGSEAVHMTEAARLTAGTEFRVHIAQIGPMGVLGRHPTRLWQLFHVMTGSGWVSGQDGEEQRIHAGQAVMWSPGEHHESKSDDGMSVVIIQASSPLPYGD
jgi:quercetin dioxygenase-like cupin family protein